MICRGNRAQDQALLRPGLAASSIPSYCRPASEDYPCGYQGRVPRDGVLCCLPGATTDQAVGVADANQDHSSSRSGEELERGVLVHGTSMAEVAIRGQVYGLLLAIGVATYPPPVDPAPGRWLVLVSPASALPDRRGQSSDLRSAPSGGGWRHPSRHQTSRGYHLEVSVPIPWPSSRCSSPMTPQSV